MKGTIKAIVPNKYGFIRPDNPSQKVSIFLPRDVVGMTFWEIKVGMRVEYLVDPSAPNLEDKPKATTVMPMDGAAMTPLALLHASADLLDIGLALLDVSSTEQEDGRRLFANKRHASVYQRLRQTAGKIRHQADFLLARPMGPALAAARPPDRRRRAAAGRQHTCVDRPEEPCAVCDEIIRTPEAQL